MRNIREILRQKWSLNRSHREVAASLNISIGGVSKIVGKADEAALTRDAGCLALVLVRPEDPANLRGDGGALRHDRDAGPPG